MPRPIARAQCQKPKSAFRFKYLFLRMMLVEKSCNFPASCFRFLLIAPVLAAAGCTTDYFNTGDGIYAGAGYAMQHNLAVHRADPYPQYGTATGIWTDGKRAADVVRRHRGAGPVATVATVAPVAVAP